MKTVVPLYFADTYGFAICGYRKTVAPIYFADTYGFAICGYRIKRGVAKLLEKFIKFNTYGSAIRGSVPL